MEGALLGRSFMRENIGLARVNVRLSHRINRSKGRSFEAVPTRPCVTASVLPGATLQGIIHEQHQPRAEQRTIVH